MEDESMSLYDSRLQCQEITMLKTILPFFNPTAQKNLSMLISYFQLQKTIEFFQDPDNTMSIRAMEHGSDNTVEMLHALRKVCPEQEQKQLDQVLNIMQMLSTYEVFFQSGD